MNVFKIKSDSIKHFYILYNVTNIYTHLFNFNKIRNILISRIFNKVFEDIKDKNISVNAFDEKDLKEISFNN